MNTPELGYTELITANWDCQLRPAVLSQCRRRCDHWVISRVLDNTFTPVCL